VPYKTSPYMGCPYMPKIHIWLAYMHVMYGPTYDFFTRALVNTSIFRCYSRIRSIRNYFWLRVLFNSSSSWIQFITLLDAKGWLQWVFQRMFGIPWQEISCVEKLWYSRQHFETEWEISFLNAIVYLKWFIRYRNTNRFIPWRKK